MTRQRKWQLKKLAQGLCPQCGKEAIASYLCRICADKYNLYQNRRTLAQRSTPLPLHHRFFWCDKYI